MSRFKILFLGTPDFAVPSLEALIQDSHFDILAVVTQPDRPAGRSMKLQSSPVKQLALSKNIPVLTPESVNTPEFVEHIKVLRPESAVVVAFGQILKPDFMAVFPRKLVNIHGSLLPHLRGAAPIQRSLTGGDSETGVTLQVLVQELDAGPVIGVRKMAIPPDMRADALYENLKKMGPELLTLDYLDFMRGQISPTEQDHSQKTIAKKIRKEEGLIDWNRSAVEIYNLFRGLYLWPGVWTLRDGKVLKIKGCRPVSLNKGKPGDVSQDGSDSIIVRCGTGGLEIFEVQPESRGVMKISEYVRGFKIPGKL